MLSATNVQSWYTFPLFLDREKSLGDDGIIRKIIQKTIPQKGDCKILDVNCGDGKRLLGAIERNSSVQGVGLVRRNVDISGVLKDQLEERNLKVVVSDINTFMAHPEFDLLYFFGSLSDYPENRHMELLQYSKMLLKPGGLLVTAAAKNNQNPNFRPAALRDLLQKSGFYKVRSYRLSASLRLVTGERINKIL
jgi:SAM-dependent methyltransferase